MSHNPDPRRESGVSPHGSAGIANQATPGTVEEVGQVYAELVQASISEPANVTGAFTAQARPSRDPGPTTLDAA